MVIRRLAERMQFSSRLAFAFLAIGAGFAFYALLIYARPLSILPGYPAVIVAFALWLIAPGWLLQRTLFATRTTGLIEQITVAFLMSLALAALPGLVALRLHWSIDAFALSYAALASIVSGLSILLRQEDGEPASEQDDVSHDEEPQQRSLRSHLPLLLMIAVPLLAVATSPWWADDRISRDFDDWVYMSYVTEYVGSDALDASVPFLDTRPGQFGRMQFNVWVVTQSLIADNAGVEPFDLLIDYLPPLMTLLVVAAMFTLARVLFRSTSIALLAAMFVLAYAALDQTAHEAYGRNVFARIGEDKMVASFILLPLGLMLSARFLSAPSVRTYAAPLLAIFALFAAHPIALLFLGVAIAPLAVLRTAAARSARTARAALLITLPWIALVAGFYIWTSGPGVKVLIVNEPFRRAFHVIDVTDDLIIGNYHMFLHPMMAAAVLLALPLWLMSRRSIGNQVVLASVAGVLLIMFVPYLATEVADALNEEAVYRLHWLVPVPLVLAYALHHAIRWLTERWQLSYRKRIAQLLPVAGVALVMAVALVIQEQYAILDDNAYYEYTNSAELLPWTGGSIFLGGVDRAFGSGTRPTDSQKELLAEIRATVPPESEVLVERSTSRFLYGMTYRVRPVDFIGAANYLQRRQVVTAFELGLLDRTALDEAVQTYGIEAVAVKKRSLADSALRSFAQYGAQDFEPRSGAPDLVVRTGEGQDQYQAWAFGSSDRAVVGGPRFTIPNDIDPEESTLDFVIRVAPSALVIRDRTVRMVLSYRKVDEGADPDGESGIFDVVTPVILPAGTDTGEAVTLLRSPETQFDAGDVYEIVVWRFQDAEEDTYPNDVWFIDLKVNYISDTLDQVGETPFYFYVAVP